MDKRLILFVALAMPLFVRGRGYGTTADTTGIELVNCSANNLTDTGFEADGSNHILQNSSVSSCAVGISVPGTNVAVIGAAVQNSTGDGIVLTGVDNFLRDSSAAASGGTDINNVGSGSNIYNNRQGTTSGLPTDFLFGFEGTFTCLGLLKGTADDILDTVTLCCPCDFFITQNDIPYTISAPGFYCLTEALTGTGYAIEITADGVVLDLRDKIINGAGIYVNSANNVMVRNGTISDSSLESIFVEGASNVIIEHITVVAPNDKAMRLRSSDYLQVQNCTISAPLQNGLFVEGASNSTFANVKILEADGAVIADITSSNNTYDSIISYVNLSNYAFFMDDINGVMRNCASFEPQVSGFKIGIGTLVGNGNTLLENCLVVGAGSGVLPSINILVDNITLKGCIVKNGNSDGFVVTGSTSTLIDCQAIDNAADGFQVNGTNVILRNCIAESNDIGFNFQNGSSGCKALSCCAVGNVDGFNNDGSNRFFNNIAYDNSVADFVGVTIAPVLAATMITSVTGNYWINIST